MDRKQRDEYLGAGAFGFGYYRLDGRVYEEGKALTYLIETVGFQPAEAVAFIDALPKASWRSHPQAVAWAAKQG